MDDFVFNTGAPTSVRDCLAEARNATSPAETVKALFLAVSYQQQQIERLELAVGVQDAIATEAVRESAKKTQIDSLGR